MFTRCFQFFALCATLISGNAFGQCDSGCGSVNNCGREISQADAAGLWAGYCTESCYDYGSHRLFGNRSQGNSGCDSFVNQGCDSGCGGGMDGGCSDGCGLGTRGGLRSRMGNRGSVGSGFGGGNGCGCNLGCFGYPTSCGSCGMGGGFAGRVGGGFFHHHDRGCGGESGGGFLSRLFHHHGDRGGRFAGRSAGQFSNSANNCGCNGAYFGEAVGYEYGNAGMQSYAAGSSGFGSGCDGGAPAAAQPVMNQTQNTVEAPLNDAPSEPGVAMPEAAAEVPK